MVVGWGCYEEHCYEHLHICTFFWVRFLFKENAGMHPTPLLPSTVPPAPVLPRANREMMRKLGEAQGTEKKAPVLRPLHTPSQQGHQAVRTARNLSPLDLPFSAPPRQSLNKRSGAKREKHVFICSSPCLLGAGKAVLGVECWVCRSELPAATALPVLLLVLIRTMSFPEVHFQHVPLPFLM